MLSAADVAAARSVLDEPEKWRLGGSLVWHRVDDPKRVVADQLVDAVRRGEIPALDRA